MSNVKGKMTRGPGLRSTPPPRSHQLPPGSAVMTPERQRQRQRAEQQRVRNEYAEYRQDLRRHAREVVAVGALTEQLLTRVRPASRAFCNDDVFRLSATLWLLGPGRRALSPEHFEQAARGESTPEARTLTLKIEAALRPSVRLYNTTRLTELEREYRALLQAHAALSSADPRP